MNDIRSILESNFKDKSIYNLFLFYLSKPQALYIQSN